MERQDIDRINKIKYKKPQNVNKGEEDKCPICITEFENGDDLR